MNGSVELLVRGVLIGPGTIEASSFVMQPAMGAGIAGSQSPNPRATRLRNPGTNTAYGVGPYLSAVELATLRPGDGAN
jgi:hypothetical protein